MNNSSYQNITYALNEIDHKYGAKIHLLKNPYLLQKLSILSTAQCKQPSFNRILRELYWAMCIEVSNVSFPRNSEQYKTRMYSDDIPTKLNMTCFQKDVEVSLVSLARAGITPSMTLFEQLSEVLPQENVRVDHIFLNRTVNTKNEVTGVSIHGSKIGGNIENRYMIISDPMGATGGSICSVIEQYHDMFPNEKCKWIALHLIITPEYIRYVNEYAPELEVFALRLDRGMSNKKVLASLPGTYPDEEFGLNKESYIVPGAGGLGELINNSWV